MEVKSTMYRTTALLAAVLVLVIPTAFSRHINTKIAVRNHGSQTEAHNDRRHLPKTHLRLHVTPPKTLHVSEGVSEYLECQAGGTPSALVHWQKNGKRLSQSNWENERSISLFDDDDDIDGTSKMDISSTVSRLYLDCLSPDDEGEYTCVAENAYHRASATTELLVSPSNDKACKDKADYGKAPRIYSWTKTMLEKQGQETKLLCRADGQPKPTIYWLGTRKEPILTEDITKYEVLPSGDLIIRDLRWSDMGNYICVAENKHGKTTAEVFLYPATPE